MKTNRQVVHKDRQAFRRVTDDPNIDGRTGKLEISSQTSREIAIRRQTGKREKKRGETYSILTNILRGKKEIYVKERAREPTGQ
jgi:hypothetical protein